MKIVICDDEKIYVDKVYDIVKKYCENDEISCYENAEQLLNDIENSTYNNDIYILDIEIDNVNGLDIAKAIREKDTSALIIFLTNYDKYVYDAFEVKTFRYIINLKNIKYLDGLRIVMENDVDCYISRDRLKEVKDKITNFWG